jgi:Cu(I)/Ag(I) efflux system membrane fusion protein
MKLRVFLLMAGLALAAGVGWLAGQRTAHPPESAAPAGRKILYYQSSMHPWIKSVKPGKCTICGMDLVPVFEGEKGFQVADNLVVLSTNAVPVVNVRSELVARRLLTRTLRFAGTIQDNETRRRYISAYVDGRVDQLAINYLGAEVVEGQRLATFYSPNLLAAEREYQSLLKPDPQAGANDLQGQRSPLIAAAAQRLKQLGLTDRQISSLAEKAATETHTEILAPMSGTVMERLVYEGQYVKEGDRLFTLADFSTMWFVFDVYERDLGWLQLGQALEITVPALPGKTCSATVSFIEPSLNELTRSAKVRVELPNPLLQRNGRPQRELLNRLYAEAEVKVESPGVLAVPRTAILSPGGQPLAYVDKGQATYELRPLKTGRVGDEFCEVLEGLSEGEKVVTQGNLLIDSQAQLNRSAKGPDPLPHQHPAMDSKPQPPPVSEAQAASVRELLAAAHAASQALAGDDLPGYETASHRLAALTGQAGQAFPPDHPWHNTLQDLEKVAPRGETADLKQARQEFNTFSPFLVEWTKQLRNQKAFAELKIYRCPMAPKPGVWMQLKGPLRNPYYGSEMLDCGEEVAP